MIKAFLVLLAWGCIGGGLLVWWLWWEERALQRDIDQLRAYASEAGEEVPGE